MQTVIRSAVHEERAFRFVGEDLCLDFANTVSGRKDLLGGRRDSLHNYADLVAWARQAGALTNEQATELRSEAERRPEEAQATLEHAAGLREALYHIFSATLAAKPTPESDLAVLNSHVAHATSRLHLISRHQGKGCAWQWAGDGSELDRMLWPVSRAAADLLTSNRLEKVRMCSGESCGWLFLDLSRNHTRRWCDMRDCGNRAKVSRHRRRLSVVAAGR